MAPHHQLHDVSVTNTFAIPGYVLILALIIWLVVVALRTTESFTAPTREHSTRCPLQLMMSVGYRVAPPAGRRQRFTGEGSQKPNCGPAVVRRRSGSHMPQKGSDPIIVGGAGRRCARR
jgi:hypothetical protein